TRTCSGKAMVLARAGPSEMTFITLLLLRFMRIVVSSALQDRLFQDNIFFRYARFASRQPIDIGSG
ncbi:MAG: hypothetical protein V3U10_04130, partial [Bacteroidota bacterium]